MNVFVKLATVISVAALTACAPSSYMVKHPTPSGLRYAESAKATATNIAVTDKRQGNELVFNTGILQATLMDQKKPLDPVAFLTTHSQAELASRGLPVRLSQGGEGQSNIKVNSFRMQNHRVSGFSPYVTFTFINADIDTAKGKKRIGVFVKRGKVPVWSFDEVIEPTLNQPLSLAVKEFSSKLSNHMFAYQADEQQVDALIQKISGKLTDDTYMDVYNLGFTNHPKAIETLTKLTTHADEYVRLAAISSLGNIGAVSQMDLLKSIYNKKDGLWQDRAMALKAIADLDTADSRAFLVEEQKKLSTGMSTMEVQWNLQILSLYI